MLHTSPGYRNVSSDFSNTVFTSSYVTDVLLRFSQQSSLHEEYCYFCTIKADLEDMVELTEMRQELMDRVQTIMNKAQEYRNSFDNYAYLWVDDRKEFMRQFLLYNHVLTTEEIEAHAEDGVPECPPTLEQFKEQVQSRPYYYFS